MSKLTKKEIATLQKQLELSTKQKTISKKVVSLYKTINRYRDKLADIQNNECGHPSITYKECGYTGDYYSGYDGYYWYEFKCPDCLNSWSEEQRNSKSIEIVNALPYQERLLRRIT